MLAHRRSPEAFLRRQIRSDAFFDKLKKETICQTSSWNYTRELYEHYGEVDVSLLTEEPGDVLYDSRGQGAYDLVD